MRDSDFGKWRNELVEICVFFSLLFGDSFEVLVEEESILVE